LKRLAIGREPSLASGCLRFAGAVAAIALAGSLSDEGAAQPAPSVGRQIVWLDQGWSPAVRARYHNQSQGTLTLPIPRSWFLALQQPEDLRPEAGLFSDPAYLDRFGFIPSPQGPDNRDGLPVGFARTTGRDPNSDAQLDQLGFTCAACHTGRFDVGATSVFIDGAPARIDLQEFGTKLALALGETGIVPGNRFRLFADRVERIEGHRVNRVQLFLELGEVIRRGLGQYLQTLGSGGIEEGVGRLDALNRIGNTVFADGMRISGNNVPITAPVNFPHIWDVSWFFWVQYNGSIQQPMVRNAGEAMGVSASVNYNDTPTPRFTSTLPIRALHDEIEQMLAGPRPPSQAEGFTGLRAPAWPGDILPPIRTELLARGAEVYRDRCQGCHLPPIRTPEFWASDRWTQPNAVGERYLDLHLVPIATVGTDPAQATDMANRIVRVRAALGLPGGTGTGPQRSYGFGRALGDLVALAVNRWYDTNNIPPAERQRLNGFRPNGIRAPLSYKARPLDGIWATAPYLHNGSVPNLWDLLSPYSERNRHCFVPRHADRCILLFGTREFDPVRVGYVNGGSFRLNTSLAGNRNTGHLFETRDPANSNPGIIGPLIPPEDRSALIEFLKTL
jgi:processive rubber oxygenase RoxA-like protein